MLPNQMKDFSQSLVAVSLFSSNILFWLESGYFEASAEEKPLLHTWSLAVEEQYYLIFPIFLFFAWRLGHKKLFLTIIALSAISLLLSEWGWRNAPTANFYLAPARAWELLAGSISAFIIRAHGVKQNNALSLAGIIAILFSIFYFTEETPFPSLYTLVPVVGVMLLILYGGKDTIPAKILSTKILVGIGLISYSAYLWHQPLFAFARIRLTEKPEPELMAALSFLSILLAAISWKYIEQPFRKKAPSGLSTKTIFSASIVGILLIISVGVLGHKQDGFNGRTEIAQSIIDSIARTPRHRECFKQSQLDTRDDWFCKIGNQDKDPSIFVMGDSHALSFLPAIDSVSKELNISGLFTGAGGCTPFLKIHALRKDQLEKNCNKLNKRVFDYVKEHNIKHVFLVARWTYYTDGGYNDEKLSYIALSNDAEKNKTVSREAFAIGLRETIKAYKNIGVHLTIIPQTPQQKFEPLELYKMNSMSEQNSLAELSISLEEHFKLQSYVNTLFKDAKIDLLDFTPTLCFENHCPVGTNTISYYYDDDHLGLSGSKLLEQPTLEYLRKIQINTN